MAAAYLPVPTEKPIAAPIMLQIIAKDGTVRDGGPGAFTP